MFIPLTKVPSEGTIVTLRRTHMRCFCLVERWQEEFQMSPNEHGDLKKNKGREMFFFMTTMGVDLNPGYLSEPSGEPVRILMFVSVLLNLLLQEQGQTEELNKKNKTKKKGGGCLGWVS